MVRTSWDWQMYWQSTCQIRCLLHLMPQKHAPARRSAFNGFPFHGWTDQAKKKRNGVWMPPLTI